RDEEMEMFFKTLFDRISAAGGLFFAAAGNENQNVNQRYVYPSRISSQIFLASGDHRNGPSCHILLELRR
ncbi:MAG TPA: hypothetical protein PK364_06175, partial [Synergistaceae bacterium]|nr:hypothetical protein [Synergistaceae bacterium]